MLRFAVAALVTLASLGTSLAEDAKRWEVEVALPVWIPGNYGTITVDDRVSHVHTTPGDVVDLLTSGNAFAGEGYFEFRYDRLFTFADAFGGYVDESVSTTVPTTQFPRLGGLDIDAKLKLKQVLAEFGVGYRVGQWSLPSRRRPLTLGVYVGARYYWFETRLRASASVAATLPRQTVQVHRAVDVTETFDWADPLVGLRWDVPLLDCLTADFRGDIGGFEAGSELSWELVAGLRYWVGWQPMSLRPWLGAGYRALGFERDSGSHSDLDLQYRGPYAAAGVVF